MLYAFVETNYTTQPELFVASDEAEMLSKLKRRFRITESKATNFDELEKELAAMGRGYHGAAELYFKLVTAN